MVCLTRWSRSLARCRLGHPSGGTHSPAPHVSPVAVLAFGLGRKLQQDLPEQQDKPRNHSSAAEDIPDRSHNYLAGPNAVLSSAGICNMLRTPVVKHQLTNFLVRTTPCRCNRMAPERPSFDASPSAFDTRSWNRRFVIAFRNDGTSASVRATDAASGWPFPAGPHPSTGVARTAQDDTTTVNLAPRLASGPLGSRALCTNRDFSSDSSAAASATNS